MIQGDFSRLVGSKSIRFSGGQFCFGVQTLHDATGKLFFGPEPVQYQGLVPPEPPNAVELSKFPV